MRDVPPEEFEQLTLNRLLPRSSHPEWTKVGEQVVETKAATIREELRSLETTAADVFKAPPVEWVTARLEKVQEVLERETGPSALLLRRILGPIRLAPVTPQVGRPYYQAEAALQVLG